MGLEIYEDPVSPSTPAPMNRSNRKPLLASGRTPLGKRTNQGSALESNQKKESLLVDKHNSSHSAVVAPAPVPPAPEAENTASNRRVHFGSVSLSNAETTTKTPQVSVATTTQVSPLRSAQTMNDFRRALRPPQATPATPAASATLPRASSTTTTAPFLSPHTLLETEMESSPEEEEDSLLVSPGGGGLLPLHNDGCLASQQKQTPLSARQRRQRAFPLRVGGSALSQKPQRILATEKDPSVGQLSRKMDSLPTQASAPRLARRQWSQPTTSQPISTLPTRASNGTANRKESSLPKQASLLSRRIPSPPKSFQPRKHASVESDVSIAQNETAPGSDAKGMLTKEAKKLVNQVIYTQRRLITHQPSLVVATRPSPEPTESVPPSQTHDTSAWKSAHAHPACTDSPMVSTPHGVCLDLSSVFQKAQSRPRVVQKLPPPKTMPEPTIAAPCPELQASQAQQQCDLFANWLNATMCPEEDSTHTENDPWRSLALHQRMAHIRQRARALWQSTEMQQIRDVIEHEINKEKIQIRADRDLHADLTQRKALLSLLLGSYETPWLRLGLEALSGQVIDPRTQTQKSKFDHKPIEKSSLSRMQVALRDFIVSRVLFDQAVLARYTKGKCKVPSGQFEVDYKADMRMLVLYRVMVLIFYLDHAKQAHLLEQTLFQKTSQHKSTKDMLASFCRLFLASSGDIVKHFHRVGLRVYHVQEPLDEIDFAVNNIATDLRDGIRLGRLTEVLTSSTYQSLLRSLRVPAVSRLPKIHNVSVVLDRLGKEFTLPVGVAAHHVVDGHRDKVLQLLWALVAYFCLPDFLKPSLIRKEISRIEKMRGRTEVRQVVDHNDSSDMHSEEDLKDLILQWTNTVFSDSGIHVKNLSTDWADGVPCCLLVSFYHPELLDKTKINPTNRSDFKFHRALPKNFRDDTLWRNERDNWEIAGQCIMRLGSVTGLPSADSGHPPHERTTLMSIAFLCERLIESSSQERACRKLQNFVRRRWRLATWAAKIAATGVIVRAWSKNKKNYYRMQFNRYGGPILCIENFVWKRKDRLQELKKQRVQRQQSFQAAARLQAMGRHFLARKRFLMIRGQIKSSIRIQALWRRVLARRTFLAIQKESYAAIRLQQWWFRQLHRRRVQNDAAISIQKRWRGFWTRIECDIAHLDAIDVQKYIRRGLAVLELRRRRYAVALLQKAARKYLSCQKVEEVRRHRLLQYSATSIQKHARRFRVQGQYTNLRRRFISARLIQSAWRAHTKELAFHAIRSNTVTLQAFLRKYFFMARFKLLKRTAVKLQSLWRRKCAILSFRRSIAAVVCIQSKVRRSQAEHVAEVRRKSVLLLQSSVRGALSRNMKRKMIASKVFCASQSIQSWWRSKFQCRTFLISRSAALKIQTSFRTWSCAHNFRRTRSATLLAQRCIRSYRIRREFVTLRQKVVLCQTVIRRFLHARRFIRQQEAAILLQEKIRRWHAKIHAQRETATLRIQTRYRVHLAEKQLSHLHLNFREKLRRKNWAATVLQSHFRRYRVLSDLAEQSAAVIRIQGMFRLVRDKVIYSRYRQGATIIQKIVRRSAAQKEANTRRVAVRALQSAMRVYIAVRQRKRLIQLRKERIAALTIQCWIRCSFARQTLCKVTAEKRHAERCEAAAIKIQRVFRSYLVPFRAARTIQKTWRCYSTLVDYCWTLLSVYTIQSIVRRHFAVQECNSRRYAVYVLQNFGKIVLAKRRRDRYLHHVTRLQAIYRGSMVRQELSLQHLAASIIQRRVRGALIREQMYLRHVAARHIQRTWRGFDVYANYMWSLVAATTIQRAFRRHQAEATRTKCLAESLRRNRSAKSIQCTFRWYRRRRLWEPAAVCVQKAWKAYQSRRAFYLLRRRVTKLQGLFRGYTARKKRTQPIRRIVNRLQHVDLSPRLRLGNKTRAALHIISNSLSLSEIMGATKTLEVATRYSAECCQLLIEAGATTILFSLIRTCNRSLPHKELLQVALRTILNVCKYCGWDDSCPDGAGACVDLVQIFRDKPEIFVPAVKLLSIAVKSSQQSRDWCGTAENSKRLRNVHALCARKQPQGSNAHDKAVRKAIKTLFHVVDMVSFD